MNATGRIVAYVPLPKSQVPRRTAYYHVPDGDKVSSASRDGMLTKEIKRTW